MRDDFEDSTMTWCARGSRVISNSDFLGDIFDAELWRRFMSYKGQPFLNAPGNLLIALNFDFFQPFDNSTYSVGCIYATILNLPRSTRYKPENVMLLGVVPGPDEPELTINGFLRPIVDDLLRLERGIRMPTALCPSGRLVRALLALVTADTPAGKKVCGYTAHSSTHGCNFCNKLFARNRDNRCLYGGSCDEASARTYPERCAAVKRWLECQTLSAQTEIERETGIRFSQLDRLPYLHLLPNLGLAIDCMHLLFLGVAKSAWGLWRDRSLISGKDLAEIQAKMDCCRPTNGFARVKRKFEKDAAFCTASDWMAWVLVYSSFCLGSILPTEDFHIWQQFVAGCQLICCRGITVSDIALAQEKFNEFLRKWEERYGEEAVKFNFHMLSHLSRSITAFGPIYSTWLFAFERFNGIMGSFPTTGRPGSLEIELMKRYQTFHFTEPNSVVVDGEPVRLDGVMELLSGTEQLRAAQRVHSTSTVSFSTYRSMLLNEKATTKLTGAEKWPEMPIGPNFNRRFELTQVVYKKVVAQYVENYSATNINFIAPWAHRFTNITLFDTVFRAAYGRGSTDRHVMLTYLPSEGDTETAYPAEILYFFRHEIRLRQPHGGVLQVPHYFAVVRFFQRDPQQLPGGITVWKADAFYTADFGCVGEEYVVPVLRLTRKFAPAFFRVGRSEKIAVIPVHRLINV
jgi:hypothetical protein